MKMDGCIVLELTTVPISLDFQAQMAEDQRIHLLKEPYKINK